MNNRCRTLIILIKKLFLQYTKKKVIDNIMDYWIKTSLAKLSKRFSKSKLFALKDNFK